MKSIITILLILVATLTVSVAYANGLPNPPATPIEGGLSLLLAAGGLYGLKKLKDQRDRN